MNRVQSIGNRKRAGRAWISIGALAVTAVLFGGSAITFVAQEAHKTKPAAKTVAPKITEKDRIIHVLNRMAFGPRPGDVDAVSKIGLGAYVDQQLHPDLVDDSALETKLHSFPELQLSDADIEAKYKDFVEADQSLAKLRREAQKKTAAAAPAAPMTQDPAGAVSAKQTKKDDLQQAMMDNPDMAKEVQDTRLQLASAAEPIGLLHEEFDAAKLLRSVESQRQFQEVMVDFWSNHFNIDIRKAPCGVLKVLDDRDAIRPHVFGRFRDLLEASATSPAMLVYLDNFQSVADTVPRPGRGALRQAALLQGGAQVPVAPKRVRPGLNENYGRELMELHTLGVDGGYTQQDVREVSRCFTGWSIGEADGARARINRYSVAGVFQFYPRLHDMGSKTVLGVQIPAGGGTSDAETVLDILCTNPATMRHISYQLCERLVSDDPPKALVDKCVATWKRTDGDLREIYKTILTSPEFYAPEAMRRKIKSPFEYAVSSVRALNGTLDPLDLVSRRQLPREANSLIRPPQGGGYIDINTNTLLGQIGTMGEPIFQYQAPTGFPEDSRKWVSSGALISRLNFSLALTQGKIRDVKLQDLAEDSGGAMDPSAEIDRLSQAILNGEISPSTKATLLSEAKASDKLSAATIAALLLGSPEFQRR